jgi:hypothetical protein
MFLTAHRRVLVGGALLACCVFAAAAMPACAVERALAGVTILSSAQQIIRKYGNPTYILTGGQTFTGAGTAAGASTPASTGIGPLPPMAPPAQQTLPVFGDRNGQAGGTAPSQNASYASGQTTSQTDASGADPGEVTYVYQKRDGTTYQFLLASNGKVIQITALGYKPQAVRTSRGITLGSTYSQVLAKYGNPESIEPSGLVTLLTYTNRAHVAFQLVSNKVVGIHVAAVQ